MVELNPSWILKSLGQCFVCLDMDGLVVYASAAAIDLSDVEYYTGIDIVDFLPLVISNSNNSLSEELVYKDIVDCKVTLPHLNDSLFSLFVSDVLNDDGNIVGRSLSLLKDNPTPAHSGDEESHLDPLTELMGRQKFERRLENLVNDASTSSRTHALLYIDIDQFKLINDTSGHGAGDNLIKTIADSIGKELFVGDMFCRLGGDEFGILLSNVDIFEAQTVANRLVKTIKRMPFFWSGISHKTSISIGVVIIDEFSHDRESVMSQADVAMYSAKEAGRGRVHVYDKSNKKLSRLHDDMDWVHRINKALADDDFCLVTERILPLVDELNRTTIYNEILVRMRYNGDVLRPGQFMPAAERFGLMPQIDRWVIKNFFNYLQRNVELNSQNVMYSINISGQSLCQESFLDFVYRCLRRGNINPEIICFEITETVAITNFSVVTRFIQRVHELGGKFALDDFGTGMSSFGYLQELPVDFVKIDGLFVHDIDKNPVHEAMVRSINDISHVLGKRTIAEFVERQEVMEQLQSLGVDYAQGYLHGRPQDLVDQAKVNI
ncbi:Cyclic di-GMP phosphodiesterase PdeB [Zhongshania aliphaticivorans]|uniref:Cyclic di-GMP phosphodiesterase PdeB n=1 Tax=Zhongshania aliphaticivorans TaxID=1470434 RepID=A0A5S9NB09_9GAMM|nr:EAL domain-containing protein [Zhongshania aliphaticivorans]CAA0087176.1 Cyclic di-GMP phosphodiesterase PdeB [Zhongshania aliphaticivorans]CAA0114203.1 Cyclic di-GMP phosphodiesterase PdeB [Zhongshania aliphaticivorans]